MRVETDGEPLVEAAAKLVQGYGIPGHLIHGFANYTRLSQRGSRHSSPNGRP